MLTNLLTLLTNPNPHSSPAADTVSRVVVNATAISQAVSSCQQDIEQIVGDVCKGQTTADLAVTASAQAVAKVSWPDPGA